MPLSHDQIVATAQAYIDAFNRCDHDAVTALFAADGKLEDPVGGPAHQGTENIRAFYKDAMVNGAQLEMKSAISTAVDTAAFAMQAKVGPITVDVVELQHLNAEGKIVHMKAYFSQANMTGGNVPGT